VLKSRQVASLVYRTTP